MEKGLRKGLADDNFNKKNIENVGKLIEETPISETFGMFVNESGDGNNVTVTKRNREICAKSLLK